MSMGRVRLAPGRAGLAAVALTLLPFPHALAFQGRTVSIAKPGDDRRIFVLDRELKVPYPGALSFVYVGHARAAPDQRVAVKLSRYPKTTYAKEHEILTQVNDPRLPRSFGVGVVEGEDATQALVLGLAAGGQLGKSYGQWAPRAPGKAVRIAMQLARAMRSMEDAGWRHNDLHPANIHIENERSRTVAVLDVGGATRASEGSIRISPYYSPAKEAIGPPEINADVYAVAAILLHMITGTANRDLIDQLPPGVMDVVAKALHPDPLQRYRKPQELINALRPFQADR